LRTIVSLVLVSFLAGCTTPFQDSAIESSSPSQVVPEELIERSYEAAFVLTAVGSAQVHGEYVHPGTDDLENYNCVSIKVSGSALLLVNATASWPSDERLVLFWFERDLSSTATGKNYTVGGSPLSLESVPPTENDDWLFVGIESDSDAIASVGLEDNINLKVKVTYRGDQEPSLFGYRKCTYPIRP
jgi:hypothetical protein